MVLTQIFTDKNVSYQVAVTPRDFNYTELDVSKYDLVFRAEDLPPLGFKLYRITNLDPNDVNSTLTPVDDATKYTIGNDVRQNILENLAFYFLFSPR